MEEKLHHMNFRQMSMTAAWRNRYNHRLQQNPNYANVEWLRRANQPMVDIVLRVLLDELYYACMYPN